MLDNSYDICYPKQFIEKAGFVQSIVSTLAKKVQDFALSPID